MLSMLPREAAITSTVATKHYGVAANCTYDETEDAGQPTSVNKYTGKTRVSKVSHESRHRDVTDKILRCSGT